MIAWRLALLIAGKDARVEWRNRTAVVAAAAFTLLVLLVFVFAHGTGESSLYSIAPSVLWATLALASQLALTRAFAVEREHGALDGMLLAPISRAALFWGKWLANLAFVLVVEAIALPAWVLFFGVAPSLSAFVGLAGLAVVTAVGFTAVGTLFAAMTVRTRYAELLLPMLFLPFMVPVVFFASQAGLRILTERPLGEVWGWLRLLALYDVVFLTLGTMLFPAIVDE